MVGGGLSFAAEVAGVINVCRQGKTVSIAWHGMMAQLSLTYSTSTCLHVTYLTAEPHPPSAILMQAVAVQER
jgi:hypothetical protein